MGSREQIWPEDHTGQSQHPRGFQSLVPGHSLTWILGDTLITNWHCSVLKWIWTGLLLFTTKRVFSKTEAKVILYLGCSPTPTSTALTSSPLFLVLATSLGHFHLMVVGVPIYIYIYPALYPALRNIHKDSSCPWGGRENEHKWNNYWFMNSVKRERCVRRDCLRIFLEGLGDWDQQRKEVESRRTRKLEQEGKSEASQGWERDKDDQDGEKRAVENETRQGKR